MYPHRAQQPAPSGRHDAAPIILWRRAGVALATAGLLAIAACGGSDDGAGDAVAAVGSEPVTTDVPAPTDAPGTAASEATEPPTTPATTDPTTPDTTDAAAESAGDADVTASTDAGGPVPSRAWAESMIVAWSDLLTARVEGLEEFVEGQRRGEHIFDLTMAQFRKDAQTLERYASELDAQADDPRLDAAADPLRSAVASLQQQTGTLLDLGDADPDGVRAQMEAIGPDEPPATPWFEAYLAYDFAAVDEACFELQDALTAAGYGLVDCAGSSVEMSAPGDVLEPGVHELAEFAPGLTLDLAQPVSVFEVGDYVEMSDPEGSVSADFVAIEEVADPAGLANGGEPYETIPLPDDLGPWLAQLPVRVLEQGTVETSTGPAPYWDLQVDAARAAEMNGGEVFVQLGKYGINESSGSFEFFGGPPVPEEHFILVDWRRGDDRILVYGIDELGEPLLEWIRTMLAAAS